MGFNWAFKGLKWNHCWL